MTGPRSATGRTNVKLDPDVLDRLRRWAYWERLKLQHVLEAAVIEALTAAETAHGAPWLPFPGGMTQLPAGPPLRDQVMPRHHSDQEDTG